MSASTQNLAMRQCQSCQKGAKPLSQDEAREYFRQVPEWRITDDAKGIFRQFNMKDFVSAVQFMDRIAEVAEAEDHHPDLHLTGYRKLRIDLATHSIGGLSENDFILAAKIDQLPKELKKSS